MEAVHTLRGDRNHFDLQMDTHLLEGGIAFAEGPNRAYLEMGPDTAGLWLVEAPAAVETLAAVLGIGDPPGTSHRPWTLSWIRDGQVRVRRVPLGVDRGAYLLIALAAWEVLDRQAHLFGTGPWPRGAP